jgi:hypothetical protein
MDIRKNRRNRVAVRIAGLTASILTLVAVGCATDDNVSVAEKLKYDFGIGEKPEGYVTATDNVLDRLDDVGKTEMKRMNSGSRHGEINFQENDELKGMFYKETRRYESYLVLDARSVSRTSQKGRGYVGFVEYTYQVYQGERRSTRAEAAAQPASIRTDERGRETLRYNFGPSGAWDGASGETARM